MLVCVCMGGGLEVEEDFITIEPVFQIYWLLFVKFLFTFTLQLNLETDTDVKDPDSTCQKTVPIHFN